jgi:hypothetical protein
LDDLVEATRGLIQAFSTILLGHVEPDLADKILSSVRSHLDNQTLPQITEEETH